jgi:hypothetical protein
MQLVFENCCRGFGFESPPFGFQIPKRAHQNVARTGHRATSAYALYVPIIDTRADQNQLTDDIVKRVIAHCADGVQLPRRHRSATTRTLTISRLTGFAGEDEVTTPLELAVSARDVEVA